MYGIFDSHGILIEGGFFNRDAADDVLWSDYVSTVSGAYVAKQ